ncbi:hypothetical protein Ahy_B05g079377 [Arachis hypogaea]|uniref:Aminotransferase-like plant mobile domain-containing protein n=1 Tax=Arachis hypogaea TaxID=3818 RepID=A0A444Z9Q0_ARAHY|nr:hypothetical protein Ahy_B05g079377 [Arachis hypogaea]
MSVEDIGTNSSFGEFSKENREDYSIRCIYSVKRQQNMLLYKWIIPYSKTIELYHLARLTIISSNCMSLKNFTGRFIHLELPIDGEAISGCLTDFPQFTPDKKLFEELLGELPPSNKVKQMRVHLTWFHEQFKMLSTDATKDTICPFSDNNENRVYLRWLPYVAKLDEMNKYSWGSIALEWLYRCMCWVANINITNLTELLQLLQSWARYQPMQNEKESRGIYYFFHVVREPYFAHDALAMIHPKILAEKHSNLQIAITSLIYFAAIEGHLVERVIRRFGGIEHRLEIALNKDFLHVKDREDEDR